jgi:hypothetical protein
MAVHITPEQEIWVFMSEGAEITGYSSEYLKKLAHKIYRMPEDERVIKIRMRKRRYEFWLPDLLRYTDEIGYGPHQDK